jgi:hypothetical protein
MGEVINKNRGIFLSGRMMTGSNMNGCPDSPYNGDLRPLYLVFYLGDYAGGSFSVRWNGDALLVEETSGGNFNCTQRAISPVKERWESFWKGINDIGVWSWDKTYSNPHGCCGVTYWHLVLETRDKAVSCSGEDRFPGGASPEMTPEFRAMVNVIKTLCGDVPVS